MTNGRASSAALDALHSLLAEAQGEELRRNLERSRLPKRIPDPEGVMIANPDYEPLNTKLVAVALKFLADNGIDAPATSPRFSGIMDQLKNLEVDDPTHLTN